MKDVWSSFPRNEPLNSMAFASLVILLSFATANLFYTTVDDYDTGREHIKKGEEIRSCKSTRMFCLFALLCGIAKPMFLHTKAVIRSLNWAVLACDSEYSR